MRVRGTQNSPILTSYSSAMIEHKKSIPDRNYFYEAFRLHLSLSNPCINVQNDLLTCTIILSVMLPAINYVQHHELH
ncbi:hypothetical protein Mettu_4068 [Methylobacter tundripaludum SV96]|uniref:Uncharacterized protein n=1 Tax=Methylobacter tundripaludum (strain ATCC BAA-1195 / DSM 17260 / SV96) TaxID=697282 RepID=G3J143_METTV|nr:hypothetical protein Mettu_4068 [Methylobacter tundripaludum SV96]